MLTQSAVLDRISKLLAVQEARGATEAEAQLAAEHVQRLLQEHNLSMSEVEQHGGDAANSPSRKRDDVAIRYNDMPYMERLAIGVAETNFCLGRVTAVVVNDRGHKKKRVLVVGREVNVRATTLTFDYLAQACYREMGSAGFSLSGQKQDQTRARYFLEGMATRIVERLQELKRQREAESDARAKFASGNGSHRELVLSDVYGSEMDLNNDFVNGFPAGTTAGRRRAQEEKEARIQAEFTRLQEGGMERIEAWYRSRGYGDASVKYAHTYHRSLRSGRGRGYSHGTSGGGRRERRKVNSDAYQSGRKAGSEVGLSQQVGAKPAARQIEKKN